MKKIFFFTAILAIVPVFISFSGCSGGNPSGPDATATPANTSSVPTNTPTITNTPTPVTVTGNLTLPSAQSGKNYKVMFYTGLNDLSKPVNSTTGTCGVSTIVAYSLTLTAGVYYAMAIVDVDANGFALSPSVGDYLGVYGGTWPSSWPSSPNRTISSSSTTCSITLSTATINVQGTINLGVTTLSGRQYWVFFDQDASGANSNYASCVTGTCTASSTVSYAAVVMVPGTYFLYCGVSVAGSMGSAVSGDYLGYYAMASPYYNPPASANAIIDITNPGTTYNFTEGLLP